MSRELTHEERHWFTQAGNVFRDVSASKGLPGAELPRGLRDEGAFAALLDRAGDPRTAIMEAAAGWAPEEAPADDAAAASVEDYMIDFDPFTSDPTVEQYVQLSEAERSLVAQIRDGGPMTLPERMAMRVQYGEAARAGAEARMAEAAQAAREAEPGYARQRVAEIGMRAAVSMDRVQLLTESAKYGLIDTTGEPRSWRLTDLADSALPDNYERHRLESVLASVRPAEHTSQIGFNGIQVGEHTVTLAPEGGPAAA